MTDTGATTGEIAAGPRTARFGRTRRIALLCAGAMLLAGSSAWADAILDVQGSTLGCFGSGCTDFGSPVSSSGTYGLTFTGTPFDGSTDGTGGLTDIFLGSFARANVNVPDSTPALDFTLQVTFTLPTGIAGTQDPFTALITGTNHGGGGALSIDFDNAWQLFEFSNGDGSGSFEFAVLADLLVPKNNSRNLLGHIRNASFLVTGSDPGAADPDDARVPAVPEPGSLLLVGAGLAGVLVRRSRLSRA